MYCLVDHSRRENLVWFRRCLFVLSFFAFANVFGEIFTIRIDGPITTSQGWMLFAKIRFASTILLNGLALIAVGVRDERRWFRLLCFAVSIPWLFETLVTALVSIGWDA
jgi:hypothetical protein